MELAIDRAPSQRNGAISELAEAQKPLIMAAKDDQSIGAVLTASETRISFNLDRSFWGFGGVHGGLTLGLLASAMRRHSGGRAIRSITGQFRRPVREAFEIEVSDDARGKNVSWLSANATAGGTVAVSARGVFAERGSVGTRPSSPLMPVVPPPSECGIFSVPPQFVPFARRTEIRPTGTARPFTGSAEPELTAWLRFVDDETAPDAARLIVLMDALAPSYAAVLSAPVPMPTVSFTVSPAEGLEKASSPWILLRARSDVASADGWIVERLDAWGRDGQYLGAGEQLRFLAAKS